MKNLFVMLSGLVLAGPFTAARAGEIQVTSLEDLGRLGQTSLNQLYKAAEPGAIPDGTSNGKAMFFPGTLLAQPASIAAALIWQGKVFHHEQGASGSVLYNRVFGFQAIKATVNYGPSWFDGRQSIIIDYKGSSMTMGWVRDEIREVAPGLYLGRAYARTLVGPLFALNFALDFNH